jgi:hypothetical protein
LRGASREQSQEQDQKQTQEQGQKQSQEQGQKQSQNRTQKQGPKQNQSKSKSGQNVFLQRIGRAGRPSLHKQNAIADRDGKRIAVAAILLKFATTY